MSYFFILPLFIWALVCMSAATLAARLVRPLRPAYPFAWRITLGSSLGFLLGNALFATSFLVIQTMVPVKSLSTAAGVGLATFLLLGPVLASFAGFLSGAGLGLWRAMRANARAAQPEPAPA